jgi:small subunit ribosomal protein S16
MLMLRMTRHGAKKRPYYHIVVADSRSPRDGRFIEKVGSYNPMLAKDNDKRVQFVTERVKYWLGVGAQASDRVARFLFEAKLGPQPKISDSPKKSAPRAKTQERLKLAAEAAAAAAPKAEAPVEAPAEAQ